MGQSLFESCQIEHSPSSWHSRVLSYIERCHLEDGGYFFARIPPSSGTDTYFAVKSLSFLRVKPQNPEAVVNFFLNQMKEGTIGGITGIFNAVEVTNELDQLTDDFRRYIPRILGLQNKAGGFGSVKNLYVEVTSALEQTYQATRVLKILGADFDQLKISRFVASFLNSDGGYGRGRRSTLASTFYATEILKLLHDNTRKLISTKTYLKAREADWRANFEGGKVDFIENLYWLVSGLSNLGEKSVTPEEVVSFVLGCQRQNGGFARAVVMGIPTLEYTFYAVSVLREIGIL